MPKGSGFSKSKSGPSKGSGPVCTPGSGVSQSSIPRAGYPPGGRTSATRYDRGVDSHSVDKRGK